MTRMRRFGAAVVLAGMVGGGLAMSTARLEAAKGGVPGPPPPSSTTTICSTLQTTYASLNPDSVLAQLVLLAAQSLGCSWAS